VARVGQSPLRTALGRSRGRVRRWLEPVRYLPFALGRPRSPRHVTIDPLARCNLACPLCPTGRGHSTSAGKGILSLALYCKILDQLPKLRQLSLWNWGEPLLHPQIDELISIAARRGIAVHAHSNLSLKKDDVFFERLIDAGLDSLWASVDGATEETYARYRVGGDFGLALANLERLARLKHRLHSSRPRIVWKFIVHRHNAHEVETARRMAREIGVDFTTDPIGLADDLVDYTIGEPLEERRREWLPDEPAARAPAYRSEAAAPGDPRYEGRCTQLFESPAISPAGDVMPCRYATHPGNAFGNIERSSFAEIWNNAKYRYSRSLFVRPLVESAHSDVRTNVCTGCPNFRQRKAG
jgi:radical SAM protein with 4Fe4S-binding SPASM domain